MTAIFQMQHLWSELFCNFYNAFIFFFTTSLHILMLRNLCHSSKIQIYCY